MVSSTTNLFLGSNVTTIISDFDVFEVPSVSDEVQSHLWSSYVNTLPLLLIRLVNYKMIG